ncbi:alpha/beta fold hydrolase [Hydrogenophaga sp. BPS33]|nr:alpha/beta fold hydrolase [Hydrogenophaga sp. BPS33]
MTWRAFGTGQPLVLLHGGHGSWLHWVGNVDALATQHTVWVPNMPGYGDSDLHGEGLPDLLEAMLGSLNVVIGSHTLFDLVGFSFGGLVAAHLAARRPVRRLVLLGSAGHGTRRRPNGELVQWREAYRKGDAPALDSAMRHNLAVHMLSMPAEQVDPLALRLHTDACVHTRFRSKDVALKGGLLELLAQRQAPTFMAWGEHDVTADPATLAPKLRTMFPRNPVHVLKDAGHWVQYERADTINALLLEWLREPSLRDDSSTT